MFAFKKKYFLIIENTKDINLNKIKINHKLFIIYRNSAKSENFNNLYKFRKICCLKKIKFVIANNIRLNVLLKTDGIYLSSYNKSLKSLFFKDNRKIIIGSAHNVKEVFDKKNQGCNYVILSKLFKVDYAPRDKTLGIIRFNNLVLKDKNIFPLGGIKSKNLNKLKTIHSDGFALMSEIKKKPANIINRLF